MNRKQSLIFSFVRILSTLLRLVPTRAAAGFLVNLVKVLVASRPARDALRLCFLVDRGVYDISGAQACRYGNGVHTKHRHTGYHDFFVKRLAAGDKVIDIGCGDGSLTFDMADRAGAHVTGIELSEASYRKALERSGHSRVRYLHGDALTDLPGESFDVAVLSNVLEHIEERVGFLQSVRKALSPARFLIRVPAYDRDWRVPLMQELGMDYRLDKTHHIEYTRESFSNELARAGLQIDHMEFRWGEIWCEAH